MTLVLLAIGLAFAAPTGPVTLPLRCDVWLGGIATNHLGEARALRAYEDEFIGWYQFDGTSLLARADLATVLTGRGAAFVKRRPDGRLQIGRGRIEAARFSLVPGAKGPRRLARVTLDDDGRGLALLVGERENAHLDLLDFRVEPTEKWTDENPGFVFQERHGTWLPIHFGRREFHYQFAGRAHEREANLLFASVWPRETGLPLAWTEVSENVFESTTLAGQTVALLYRARAYDDEAGRLNQPRIHVGRLNRVLMVRVPDRTFTVTDANSPTYHPRTLLWEFIEEGGPRFTLQATDVFHSLADLRLIEPLELRLEPSEWHLDVSTWRER